jgi:phosphoribosylamine--glycine ligase
VLLPRLDGDWADLLRRCADGSLEGAEVRWTGRAAVCVVLASGGYPEAYEKGKVIEGVDEANGLEDVVVFHAGTGRDEAGRLVTAGGRVLGVTALGDDLAAARGRAYEAAARIRWDGVHRRTDIARDAV